jgi:hypothetical protein
MSTPNRFFLIGINHFYLRVIFPSRRTIDPESRNPSSGLGADMKEKHEENRKSACPDVQIETEPLENKTTYVQKYAAGKHPENTPNHPGFIPKCSKNIPKYPGMIPKSSGS